MPARAVVPDFDPGKEHSACLRAGRKGGAVDLLFFECGKEAFHDGIVPAVATATHAANDAVFRQFFSIVMRGVLAAAVAVKEQSSLNFGALALAKRHLQRFMHQGLLQRIPHAPANDTASSQWHGGS